jgi:superfamily II DNA or RNA helicase
VPRAANRLSPLPVFNPPDEDQFEEYLEVVQGANEAGFHTLDEIAEYCLTSNITMANGNNYQKSNYRAVLGNLGRLGFIVEDDGQAQLRDICKQYVNGEFKPSSSEKGGEQLPLFGILFLECMQGMGIENIDPYIVDQLAYYFDTIRKEDATVQWSNSDILAKTAENWPPKSGEKPVDVDPIHGFTYLSGMTKESWSRCAQETLKLLGVIGVIEKSGNAWQLCVDEDGQEYVRKRLRNLRFQKILEDVIREMGANHEYLVRNQNKNFFRAVGRYITYRYCGGIGRQPGLRGQVINELGRIRTSLEKDYRKLVEGANRGRELLSLVRDLREIDVENIASKLGVFDDIEELRKALRSMSLHEITTFQHEEISSDEIAELLRSRGTSKRFSRLTLNKLQHQEGVFQLSSTLNPHQWQEECVKLWIDGDMNSGHQPFTGIASAVTGTGKTVMALMAAGAFVEEHPEAVISVVVPSKVLMYQWAEEAAKFLGLGADEIGFVGDGFSDSFSEGRRLIIWIVNSAVKNNRLGNDVDALALETTHMLIADECHEYGGEKYKLFLECRAEGRLAISATPPDETATGDKHPVLNTMGHQFYRLGYKQAHADDLIAGFKIRYLGIELDYDERIRYDRLSDDIRRLSRELEEIYGPQLEGGNLFVRIMAIVAAGEGNATTAQYLKAVRERKNLVREATHRDTASFAIRKRLEDEENTDFTIIYFHEQIDETKRLVEEGQGNRISVAIKHEKEKGDDADLSKINALEIEKDRLDGLQNWFMTDAAVRPGMYHSKWPNPWGRWMIDWFRNGHLNVMLSARALAQGFDLPGADHGIIRTSTSNVRQRIQTIGRMIRKKEKGKEAEIWIVYVRETTDERIFEKHDWEDELPDVEDVQTAWKLNDFGSDVTMARPEFVGGVEALPQPNRELTEEELNNLTLKNYEIGDDYDKRALYSATHVITVTEEGGMTVIDGGAPFDLEFESLNDSAEWLHENRNGRGHIHIIPNGHAIGRTMVGRVVYLTDVKSDEIEAAIHYSIEKGDSFDDFMSGFNLD